MSWITLIYLSVNVHQLFQPMNMNICSVRSTYSHVKFGSFPPLQHNRRDSVPPSRPVADRVGLRRQDDQGVESRGDRRATTASASAEARHPPLAHRRRHLPQVQRLRHRLRQLRQDSQALGLHRLLIDGG